MRIICMDFFYIRGLCASIKSAILATGCVTVTADELLVFGKYWVTLNMPP